MLKNKQGDSKKDLIQTFETELKHLDEYVQQVPRRSFLILIALISALLGIVSKSLSVGPSWILPVVAVLLLIPLSIAIFRGNHNFTRIIALSIITLVTVALFSSVLFLIHELFAHQTEAAVLFRDAAILWIVNVAVFTAWYWEVDQGGPTRRHANQSERPDFLFPQMAITIEGWADWKASFIDYLFLAFNTSSAFSPTDTLVLSARGKVLMAAQSMISLIILVVLAARAVNIA